MKKKAKEFDVSMALKILVPRRIELEQFLIDRATAIRQRRMSTQDRRHLPFGVRGRKRIRACRYTTSILYVGLNPNLDGPRSEERPQTPPQADPPGI